MEIIPAIDIIDGKCVRLTQGDFGRKTIYNENPLEVACQFQEHGIKRLHLVDLDGAKMGKIINHKILETICTKTKLTVDFGGGLKTNDDIKLAFDSGAKMVTGGSVAVTNLALFNQWLCEYGAQKIILGADVRNQKVAIHGWKDDSDLTISELIKSYEPSGIQKVICTDISKDGALQGPSFDLYQALIDEFPKLEFIASGGVTTIGDLIKLRNMGMSGAIIGKAIYEGTIPLKELSKFID